MPEKLRVTLRKLEEHFANVGPLLAASLGEGSGVKIDTEISRSGAVGQLLGPRQERAHRTRGADAPVLPIRCLRSGLWAWAGYREEWTADDKSLFAFRAAGITIHLGRLGELDKPQILRAEWAGWTDWRGNTENYSAGNAAHPHWQFDALESLAMSRRDIEATALLQRLVDQGPDETATDFQPTSAESMAISELVQSQRISAMHFPSAAAWWRKPPANAHSHSPLDVREIEKWASSSLDYLKEQLENLGK